MQLKYSYLVALGFFSLCMSMDPGKAPQKSQKYDLNEEIERGLFSKQGFDQKKHQAHIDQMRRPYLNLFELLAQEACLIHGIEGTFNDIVKWGIAPDCSEQQLKAARYFAGRLKAIDEERSTSTLQNKDK